MDNVELVCSACAKQAALCGIDAAGQRHQVCSKLLQDVDYHMESNAMAKGIS
jgi:hypothetical protein